MESNPYESPRPEISQVAGIATAVRYLVAVGCWLASLLPMFAYLLIAGRPEIIARRDENLALFVAICGVMFGLPAVGLVVMGFASWRGNRWLALGGFAAFLPLIVWTLTALLWPRR